MTITLERGSLGRRVDEVTRRALASGALLPIPTEHSFIREGDMKFVVRVLTALEQKDAERRRRAETGKKDNPFLPYDEELFVADVSDTHVALLNKFNVMDRHLLIVTRQFEDQEMLLNSADFTALCACMAEYDALGFYNGGIEAGASQPHKHLQMVPLPLAPEGPPVPIEPLLDSVQSERDQVTEAPFPFRHAFVRIDRTLFASPEGGSGKLFQLYVAMLLHLDMAAPSKTEAIGQSAPYCLLMKRDWMLLVPRSREFFDRVSINSLGFAGSFFVRNESEKKRIEGTGPLRVLKSVASYD